MMDRGMVLSRVLGFLAERGGAFKTDQAEDCHDHAEAEGRIDGNPESENWRRVDGEAVLAQHDEDRGR